METLVAKIRTNKFRKSSPKTNSRTSTIILKNKPKEVLKIRVSSIQESPQQPRIVMDESELLSLMASIKENKLLQPVSLIKNRDDGYTLIAGHRRVEAFRRLGYETIDAIVHEGVNEKDLAALGLIENIQRSKLEYIELALQYDKLIRTNVFSNISELAKSIGKNSGDVGKVINLLKLSDVVKKDLQATKAIRDIKMLDALRKVRDVPTQERLYFWAKENDVSRSEFLEEINSALKKETKNPTQVYNISNTKRSCTVKLPSLSEEKLKKLEKLIKQLVKE